LHYGIISALKIPVVSSGATWTLQLRNFLRTCITQGPEYFRHQDHNIVQCQITQKRYNLELTMPDQQKGVYDLSNGAIFQ